MSIVETKFTEIIDFACESKTTPVLTLHRKVLRWLIVKYPQALQNYIKIGGFNIVGEHGLPAVWLGAPLEKYIEKNKAMCPHCMSFPMNGCSNKHEVVNCISMSIQYEIARIKKALA